MCPNLGLRRLEITTVACDEACENDEASENDVETNGASKTD